MKNLKKIIVTKDNLNDYFDYSEMKLKVSAGAVLYKSSGGMLYNFAPFEICGKTYWGLSGAVIIKERFGDKVRFCLNMKTGLFHYFGDSSYAGFTEEELSYLDLYHVKQIAGIIEDK